MSVKLPTSDPSARLRDTARRMVFSVIRARQPVRLFEGESPSSDGKLSVRVIGNPDRTQYLLSHLWSDTPEPTQPHSSLVTPFPTVARRRAGQPDFEVREISRLLVPAYRRAGFMAIPEWVEFEGDVIHDEQLRYDGCGRALRRELDAVKREGYEAELSDRTGDFHWFFDEMYLPTVRRRFHSQAIVKSRRTLLKDFQSGFLLFIRLGGTRVAGALVRDEGDTLRLTTQGVLRGSDTLMKRHVSGAVDYHFHREAARLEKRRINVGHTRPIPTDGVFFNKRKWGLGVIPDSDGVMNLAIRWDGDNGRVPQVLERLPLIYQGKRGLGVMCARVLSREMLATEAGRLVRRYWTEGLKSMIVICPGGVRRGVLEEVKRAVTADVHICHDPQSALLRYRCEA